jgi:Tol biopolymer transport system component
MVTHEERPLLREGQLSVNVRGAARYSTDGRQLVFAVPLRERVGSTDRDILEIFLMDADGSDYRRLTHLQGSAENPQWNAEDNAIVFDFTPCLDVVAPERSTWTIRSDGSGLRRRSVNLGDPRVQFGFPFALSPDGSRVAFIGRDPTGTMGVLWTMNPDGRNRRQLTSF